MIIIWVNELFWPAPEIIMHSVGLFSAPQKVLSSTFENIIVALPGGATQSGVEMADFVGFLKTIKRSTKIESD